MDVISIIVPAYNIEKYIGRCLESIISQTYKNIEIVVVDDGSTDGTGNIVDSYAKKDSRIVVLHKENGGVSSARIKGIELSSGSYIGFVDGDDIIESDMYERLMNNAIKYDADISHCGYKMVFPDGHIDYYYGTNILKRQNHDMALLDLMKGDVVEPGLWNKLFKREIVEEYKKSPLWNKNIKINEDLLMNYIFFKKANFSVYEDITPYSYMLRTGSAATKNSRHQIIDPLKVITVIKDDVSDFDKLYEIVYKRYVRMLIVAASQNEFASDARNAKRELKLQLKYIRKESHSFKLMLMAYSVVYANVIYCLIRKMYNMCTGVNHKYDIR